MHFIVEVRIPALTVILNAERLNLALVQDSIHAGFCNRSEPVKTRLRCSLIDMLCKRLGRPGLCGIAGILWLRTGYADQLGRGFADDFFFAATAFANAEQLLNGVFF